MSLQLPNSPKTSPDKITAELHDEKHQSDIKGGVSLGMPLDQFTDEAYRGLAAGKEDVLVGDAHSWYDQLERRRQELFQGAVEAINRKGSGE